MTLTSLALGLMALAALQIALLAAFYHKVTTVIQVTKRDLTSSIDNCIVQLEGLLAIYAELRPVRALPKTRGWAASPDLLALLISEMHRRSPVSVLECSSGVSTLVLAACMRNTGSGHVFSLEHESEYAHRTRELLQLHGLTEWATVVDAPLVDVELEAWCGRWYDVSALPADLRAALLVVDGPPGALGPLARYPALPLLNRFLADRVLVVLDDAHRASERAVVDRWFNEFPAFAASEPVLCEKGCAVLERGARA